MNYVLYTDSPAFEAFAVRVLHCHPRNIVLLTDRSTVEDFTRTREGAIQAIKNIYGVDCSDMEELIVWQVMQRIELSQH